MGPGWTPRLSGHCAGSERDDDIPSSLADLDASSDPLPDEPKTELGYARRLIHVYGDRLRYVPPWRRWLVWDGSRWAHDTTGQAARWMKSIARQRSPPTRWRSPTRQTAGRRSTRARRGESAAGVAGALTLAGTEPEIAVTPDAPRRRPVPAQLPQRHPRPADRDAARPRPGATCSPR